MAPATAPFVASSLPSLAGKTFFVTGGNTGIGYETCLNLVGKNARVYMGARSPTKAAEAIAKMKEAHPDADVQALIMDHKVLNSVVEAARTFVSKEKKLHGLILNAGIMATPFEVTQDGFEAQMQVNYIAHWLLTYHLLPTLLATAKVDGPGSVRIVSVSSEGHRAIYGGKKILYDLDEIKAWGRRQFYGVTKLANILFAKTLTLEYGPGSKSAKDGFGEIWAASLHPGFIDSQLNQKNKEYAPPHFKWIFPALQAFKIMRPWSEGCVASLFVGASPEFKADMCGKYFNEYAKVVAPSSVSCDEGERKQLEDWTKVEMKKGGWI